MPKYLDYLPDVLDEYEREDLLDQPNLQCITGYRNYTLIKLFLCSGITATEMKWISWNDVNVGSGDIFIRKDDILKSRSIHVGFEMGEVLNHWHRRQIIEIGECELVFTTLKGTPIFKRNTRHMILNYGKKANINKQVSPNTLRHTYATELYKKTKDFDVLRKNLGVKSKHYLKIYALLADEEFNESVNVW